MRIAYVYAGDLESANNSEWRCAAPARAINRSSRHTAELVSLVDFSQNTPRAQAVCGPADVIVVQRDLFGPVLSAIQHWKARDKVMIADFEGAFNLLPPTHDLQPFWSKGLDRRPGAAAPEKVDPPPLTQFKWGLRLVHAATVPSKRLADDWQPYVEVHYLPNFLDLEKYQDITPEPHAGIVIGWGGDAAHFHSFAGSGVLAALQRVCRARPQVRVSICGNDRQLFDQLPLPPEQKIYRPWTSYHDWVRILSGFDIGLAPLHGEYDLRSSWIRVLEYMVMKIPWVASEGPPFQDLRAFGWLIQNTHTAWERVLLDMVDYLDEYRAEAAQEAYLFSISQNIHEHVERVLSTYAAIAARVAAENTKCQI